MELLRAEGSAMQLSIVRALLVSVISCVCATLEVSAQGQSDDALWQQIKGLGWKTAPQIGRLGAEASITLSSNVGFLGSADTSRFLELNGNPPSEDQYVLAPKDVSWFSVFTFDPSGYVRDDEKIDPDE